MRGPFNPVSISCDEHLDFNSGIWSPLHTISRCNLPQSQCRSSQANSSASCPDESNNQTISWEQALSLSAACSSDLLLDSTSFFPLSSSSSSVDGVNAGLIAPDFSFYDTTNWSSFNPPATGPEICLGNGSQLGVTFGDHLLFTPPEKLAMQSEIADVSGMSLFNPTTSGKVPSRVY